jgi:hypothetical protein
MESKNQVTDEDGIKFAILARKLKIPQDQFNVLFKNRTFVLKLLNELADSDHWSENLHRKAKESNFKLHIVKDFVVNYSKEHNIAALEGGPQTPLSNSVFEVGSRYILSTNRKKLQTIVLLNSTKATSYDAILKWALKNNLQRTLPHVPFGLGEKYPSLNYDLGFKSMYIVETTGCLLNGIKCFCNLQWNDLDRQSKLTWTHRNDDPNIWYAFAKKAL